MRLKLLDKPGLLCAAIIGSWLADTANGAVSRWNRLAREAIRFANTPPPIASRNLAILHVAVFDAVNGLTGRYVGYRGDSKAPTEALPEAAAAAAANRVLRFVWPQFTTTFDAELNAHLHSLPANQARAAGVTWGRQVADALLRERDFDGANFGVDYRPSSGPGRWQATPPLFASSLLPQWSNVTPFALVSGSQFRPGAPPSLVSTDWAQQCNEVKAMGSANSTARTAEQTETAWFWADGPGTETPPGHWNRVAVQLAEARNLSLLETARLFALLNLALADAGIACWDAKYAYDWWRPVTAIRAADTDGNPHTEADPSWTPLVSTPPFPEHVSGHSTFSAAAAAVLSEFHGSDQFEFSLESDGLFGVTRRFDRFSEAAHEAGMSRIYGGIHFRAANEGGQALGRAVGRYVVENYLLAKEAVAIRISVHDEVLELRWPAGARLEVCNDLGASVWKTLEARGSLTMPAEGPAGFFRIKAD